MITLKGEFVYMPSTNEMHETAQRMEAMFHLPGFYYGIDGVHMIFADRPVAFLTISMHNSFFCRNQKFSVNVQVVGTQAYKKWARQSGDIEPGSMFDMEPSSILYIQDNKHESINNNYTTFTVVLLV